MIRTGRLFTIAVLAAFPPLGAAGASQLLVGAVNKLPIARTSQTIELTAAQLAPIGEKDLNRIHVNDAGGKDVLCQAVDTDGDYSPDIVIFQADFAPGETRQFSVSAGSKHIHAKEQWKAYGRFARERFDDFAWENDRIAHRMYGKALETWVREPLTSSTIDIWSKRVARMVINDWYMVDDYHVDAGEGADFYSAGSSRGCGGNGLWSDEKLWVSKNFVRSRVLANGPIRVLFELTYDSFDVNGAQVSEVKRISLDAGQHLDHLQSVYSPRGAAAPLTMAIGLKKVANEQVRFDERLGSLAKWEAMDKKAGNQGLAIIVDPKTYEKRAEDRLNLLLLTKVGAGNAASYWAGFCWDKAGPCGSPDAWFAYVDQFAQALSSPIELGVAVQ